jgi:hypothetical protein
VKAERIIAKGLGNSRNVMTPHVIRYGLLSKYVAYELASGGRVNDTTRYGVTVVKYNPETNTVEELDFSSSFDTLNEAESYIAKYNRKKD